MFDKRTLELYKKLFNNVFIIKSEFNAKNGDFVYIRDGFRKVKVKCLNSVSKNDSCLVFRDEVGNYNLLPNSVKSKATETKTIIYKKIKPNKKPKGFVLGFNVVVSNDSADDFKYLFYDLFFVNSINSSNVIAYTNKSKRALVESNIRFDVVLDQRYNYGFRSFGYFSMGMVKNVLFAFGSGYFDIDIITAFLDARQGYIFLNSLNTKQKAPSSRRILLKSNLPINSIRGNLVRIVSYFLEIYNIGLKYLNKDNEVIYIAVAGSTTVFGLFTQRDVDNNYIPIPGDEPKSGGVVLIWNLGKLEEIQDIYTDPVCAVPLFFKDVADDEQYTSFGTAGGYGAKGGIVMNLAPYPSVVGYGSAFPPIQIFINEEILATSTNTFIDYERLIFSQNPNPTNPIFNNIQIGEMPPPLDTRDILYDTVFPDGPFLRRLAYYITEKDFDNKIFQLVVGNG